MHPGRCLAKDGFHQERLQQRLSHVELLLNRPAPTKNRHHRQGLSLDNLLWVQYYYNFTTAPVLVLLGKSQLYILPFKPVVFTVVAERNSVTLRTPRTIASVHCCRLPLGLSRNIGTTTL